MGKPIRIHIRWMVRADMPEVQGIENAAYEYPWTEEDFLRVLRQRNCIGMVAEHTERINRILGYMIYELSSDRLQILNFAVSKDHRRCSIGQQMIAKLEGKLTVHRRNRITCEIRESNLDALNFFKTKGFRAIKVLRDFYQEWTTEDAYLMEYRMPADVLAGARA